MSGNEGNGLLKVAVVGHTNTGKTSLMRTLMRNVDFGEVSDRPAVTRAVEAAVLRAEGASVVELFDTPGLEDSIGLLECLDARQGTRRVDGIQLIQEFLESPDAHDRFVQEARALRQVLASDISLYVIDARDRVHGKHRDELTILGYCATPVVPVLNFTADPNANTPAWREHLARVSMHAVAEFDTVVFDSRDEERLYEKLRTLLDARGDVLEALAKERRTQRRAIVRSSAILLAELLVDVASYCVSVPKCDGGGDRETQSAERRAAIDALKQAVRRREQGCVEQLLVLHRFRPGDVEEEALPIEDGRWGIDLFSPAALKEFGLHAGSAAATGAMVGLTLDVLLAGLSLGTGATAGAAIGGLIGAARTHGRRLVDRMRGRTELRCDESTLRLLGLRQYALIEALLRRGHAAVDRIRLGADAIAQSSRVLAGTSASRSGAETGKTPRGRARTKADAKAMGPPVLRLLAEAQQHPDWSTLSAASVDRGALSPADDVARTDLIDALSYALDAQLRELEPVRRGRQGDAKSL